MTAVELCARCAGDPRDGIGYHAFDCAEVAPKERVMTASERLEDLRNEFVWGVAMQQHGSHNAMRPKGSPELAAGRDCASCDYWVERWGGIYSSAFEAGYSAATSPLLARIEALEGAWRVMFDQSDCDCDAALLHEERAAHDHASDCPVYVRWEPVEDELRAALSSPSSIKEDVK